MPLTLPSHIEPVFDAETVREQVRALGRRIGEEIGGQDPLFVALLGGSVIFLADLVRAVERPVRFEFIQVGGAGSGVSSGSGGTDEPPVEQIRYPLPLDLAGQSVLVLKDVVSSGITEPYLEQQLRDHGARDVRFAALIDIPDERKTPFEVAYAAFRTGRQGLLVGYGLKHDGLFGNLPFVGRLRRT